MNRIFLFSWVLIISAMVGLISCQEDFKADDVAQTYSVLLDPAFDTKSYVSNSGTVSGTGTYTHGSNVSLSTTAQKIQYRKESSSSWSTSTGNSYTINAINANYYVRPWTQYYAVTVSGGTGGGDVKSGGSCSINAPASSDPSGKTFDKWTISGTGTIASSTSRSTSVTGVGSDCTVTANFKAVVTKNPSIVIWAEFTDGYADDVQTTMRSFRVMYRVVDGPTTVDKKYEVYGYYDSSSNQCYSYGPFTIPAGTNVTSNTQFWSSTAGFPAGITCGRMHIAVREK